MTSAQLKTDIKYAEESEKSTKEKYHKLKQLVELKKDLVESNSVEINENGSSCDSRGSAIKNTRKAIQESDVKILRNQLECSVDDLKRFGEQHKDQIRELMGLFVEFIGITIRQEN